MTRAPRDLATQLTFLGEVTGAPTNYFEVEPPPGVPRLYPRVRRDVVVHDARAMALSIEREGVVLAEHRDGVIGDFRDEHALRQAYYPAVERLVCAVTGAARAGVRPHASVFGRGAAGGRRHRHHRRRSPQRLHRALRAAPRPRAARGARARRGSRSPDAPPPRDLQRLAADQWPGRAMAARGVRHAEPAARRLRRGRAALAASHWPRLRGPPPPRTALAVCPGDGWPPRAR